MKLNRIEPDICILHAWSKVVSQVDRLVYHKISISFCLLDRLTLIDLMEMINNRRINKQHETTTNKLSTK